MPVTKIHHINFIVKDLEAAISRYAALLGDNKFITDELPERGVMTARAAVGDQWLVLVQPTDPNSAPGKYLEENGEGFFLMSLEVDDMHSTVTQLKKADIAPTSDQDRKGLLNWWVRDLNADQTLGAQIQLCEERD